MRGISDTIARVHAAANRASAPMDDGTTRLRPLLDFGANPGALRGYFYAPEPEARKAPLVVALHGCTQSASSFDRSTGWSQLAGQYDFALLYCEQQPANNANRCFNWFEPGDTQRDQGEARSIRQLIAAVQERHDIDPDRIFVTGLSAGGAMTATMLATYPELFAGGAIIAGLPHGVAHGVAQAFDRMRGYGLPSTALLQGAVRRASGYDGPWPVLSVWHGSTDTVVSVDNAEAILAQWRGVHGLDVHPSVAEKVDVATRRAWQATDGRTVLEAYIVPGMGHGVPLKTRGAGACGVAGPYMLDVGISSTSRIANFWRIDESAGRTADPRSMKPGPEPAHHLASIEPRRLHGLRIEPEPPRAAASVGRAIEDALRSAGLMK